MIKNADLPRTLRFQLLNNLAKECYRPLRNKQHKYSRFVFNRIYLFVGILKTTDIPETKKDIKCPFL